jgi:hypothetical protein
VNQTEHLKSTLKHNKGIQTPVFQPRRTLPENLERRGAGRGNHLAKKSNSTS